MLKIKATIQLLRLDKPVGILLLLYPCLLALIAGFDFKIQSIPWYLWLIFSIGSVLMRSAGCAINDFFDQDIDKHVQRTQNRPLVRGAISSNMALILTFILTLLSSFLLFFLPKQSYVFIILALFLALSYPLAKRWLAIPQSYLALAFSMSMPVAYFSNPDISLNFYHISNILFLMTANFIWVLAYDTFYAMVDKKDDQHLKIKTSALYFGRYDFLYAGFFYMAAHFLFGAFWCYHRLNFVLNSDASFKFCLLILWVTILILFLMHIFQLYKSFVKAQANILQEDIVAQNARQICFRIFIEQKYIGFLYVLLYAFF